MWKSFFFCNLNTSFCITSHQSQYSLIGCFVLFQKVLQQCQWGRIGRLKPRRLWGGRGSSKRVESGRSEGNLCSSLFNTVFCNRKRTKRRNWQKPRMQGMGGRSFGSPPTPSPPSPLHVPSSHKAIISAVNKT